MEERSRRILAQSACCATGIRGLSSSSAFAVKRWRARGGCARFCGEVVMAGRRHPRGRGMPRSAGRQSILPEGYFVTRSWWLYDRCRSAAPGRVRDERLRRGRTISSHRRTETRSVGPDVGLEAEPLFTAQIAPRLGFSPSPGHRVTAEAMDGQPIAKAADGRAERVASGAQAEVAPEQAEAGEAGATFDQRSGSAGEHRGLSTRDHRSSPQPRRSHQPEPARHKRDLPGENADEQRKHRERRDPCLPDRSRGLARAQRRDEQTPATASAANARVAARRASVVPSSSANCRASARGSPSVAAGLCARSSPGSLARWSANSATIRARSLRGIDARASSTSSSCK